MYSYIRGILAEIEEDAVVVEANGVGYHIFTTGQTFSHLPSLGKEIKVYTYLNIREDAMQLFGFLGKDELRVFKLLLGVSGIGPKRALRFAVLGDDAKAIAKAPGVGVKTAQRLILELKDKLHLEDAFEQTYQQAEEPAREKAKGAKNEAVQALVALGYSSSEALKALNGIEITEETDVEDILKTALKNMAFI